MRVRRSYEIIEDMCLLRVDVLAISLLDGGEIKQLSCQGAASKRSRWHHRHWEARFINRARRLLREETDRRKLLRSYFKSLYGYTNAILKKGKS